MQSSKYAVNDLARICAASADAAEWELFLRLSTPYASMTVARVCRIWMGQATASLVDDIVQEVFVKLCEQERKILREFEPRGEDSFFALLRVVAASVANDHFRRQHSAKRGGNVVTVSIEEEGAFSPGASPAASIHQSVLQAQLDQMLRSSPEAISERDRSLFWLYYQHGFTAEELATMSGGEYNAFTLERGFEEKVLQAARHARNRYLLTFRPSDPTPGLHAIRVRLRAGYEARVVARANYWLQSGP